MNKDEDISLKKEITMKKFFKNATLSIALSFALITVMLSPVNAAVPARTVEPVSVSKEASNDAQAVVRDSNPTIVCTFSEKNFYTDTPLEPRPFQSDVNLITLYGRCANGATDTVILHVVDRSHDGLYDTDISFEANGSYTYVPWTLPDGRYWLYFTSVDGTILKEEVVVLFTHS